MNDNDDFWDRSAELLLILAYCVGLLFAIGVIGYQGFIWLKTGHWPSIPFLNALQFLKVDLHSVYTPHSWFGLAKLAQWFLNLLLSFIGPVCIVLVAHIWNHFVSSGNPSKQANR